MNRVQIDILHGASSVREDDRDNARSAAEQVISDAGLTVEAARDAYEAQWKEFEDRAPMHGPALVWIAAEDAANLALTKTWQNPDGAHCAIS